MRTELISACQMFLVPTTIMFAALGVAGSEGLKTLICATGAATSDMWLWTVLAWKEPDPGNITPALLLSAFFVVAWGFCFFVHLGLGCQYGFERQKEAQGMYCTTPPPKSDPTTIRSLC